MRFLSLFSGIEAASVAWKPLGWECVAFSEIEKAPSSVLLHHYPDIPNLGDVTKITEDTIKNLGQIDIVVFGSPCQDLSVAGKRSGFNGERSGLFTTAINIIHWARKHCGCRLALWENVFGAFSSNEGRDFAVVVREMAGCGDVDVPQHGWGKEGAALGENGLLEWCVLDAQWFGLAQRRKRVFALADFGDWQSRSPILLEPESLRGNSPPSREAREEVAGTLASRTGAGGFPGTDESLSGYIQPVSGNITTRAHKHDQAGNPDLLICFGGGNTSGPIKSAACLTAKGQRIDFEVETFAVHGSQDPDVLENLSHTAGRNQGRENVICFSSKDYGQDAIENISPCLRAGSHKESHVNTGSPPAIAHNLMVRRLTPRECEKLQGFSENYTLTPNSNGKLMADGPRYKMLGNSMAVNCMRWLGERIQQNLKQTEGD